jgi:hypothetical protein
LDVDKLLQEAAAANQAQLQLAAVVQAALTNPFQITTYNVIALGWGELDGKPLLMVGLPNGHQLRFQLDQGSVSQLHEATSPKDEPDDTTSAQTPENSSAGDSPASPSPES